MNNLPEKVLLALDAAIKAGVPFTYTYVPPYNIQVFSTVGTNPYSFSWADGEDPFDPYKPNEWRNKMGKDNQDIYAVFFHNARFSGFFLNKEKAIELRNMLNIRHFNIAACSENKLKPILL